MTARQLIRSPETAYALVRTGLALTLLGFLQIWGPGLAQAPLAMTYGGFALLVLAIPTLRHRQRGWHLTLLNLSDAAFLGALTIVHGGIFTLAMLPVLGIAAHSWMGRRYARNMFYFLLLAATISWLSNGWQLAWEQQFLVIATVASLLLYRAGNVSSSRPEPTARNNAASPPVASLPDPVEEELDLLLLASEPHHNELRGLAERWQMHARGFTDELEFLANIAQQLLHGDLKAVIVDLRAGYTDPIRLIDTLRNSRMASELRCLCILAADHQFDEQLLIQKGYAAVLTAPLDSTLLFNALHTQPNTLGTGVSSLLRRYVSSKTTLPPLEILIASSNPVQLKVIKRLLERDNHHVYSTEKGEQALDAMTAHRFDIALLDDALKDMDGIEITRLYRLTRLSHEATPIALISNQPHRDLYQRASSAGIEAVLEQPVQPGRLNTVLLQLLKKAQAGASLGDILLPPSDTGTGENYTTNIDHQTLHELKNLGNGLAFVRELIENFISDSQQTINEMHGALADSQLDRFRDCAHAMKGSAGSVGAVRLQQLCIKIAAVTADDFASGTPMIMEKLMEELSLAQDGLLDYLNKQDTLSSESDN